MRYLISITLILSSLFSQNEIEGRWHLVGYEDNVMYQFEDNYRYSIYSTDGNFGGLEDAGNSANPYSIEENIITIDLFFGIIVSYQMNYRCEGQVVEFNIIEDGTTQEVLFREGYNYINNNCEDYGDLNDDGNINIFDIDILASYILDNSLYENGDFNQDGTLNVFDVIMLIDMIIN